MNSQFTKHTDQKHRIKLESNLIYALWSCRRAWAGTDAPFEVRTSLVGEGAEIKIKLKNGSGKTLDKKTDKIFGNRFRGTVAVPAKVDASDMLFIEVELPKHGLSGESNQVPAGPLIQVESMQWDRPEVRRGDVVKLQAKFVDLPDKTDALVAIYEYDKDGNHDPIATLPTEINGSKMELSWEFQYHEDAGQIPTKAELKPYDKTYQHPEYFFVIVIEGARFGVKQESGLMKFLDSTVIIINDEDGNPAKNKDVTIEFADGSQKKLKTDDSGKITIDNASPGKYNITFDG
jgi:hypothetical protein